MFVFFRSLRNDNKILDNKTLSLSEIYCRDASHENKRFWTIFLSAPKPRPPQKRKVYVYCRLAVSDFLWGIAQLSRDALQNGYRTDVSVRETKYQWGYRTMLGGVLTSFKQHRVIWDIAAISIAILPDMGPLVQQFTCGVVREGVIAENFPQISTNFRTLSAEFRHPFLTQ